MIKKMLLFCLIGGLFSNNTVLSANFVPTAETVWAGMNIVKGVVASILVLPAFAVSGAILGDGFGLSTDGARSGKMSLVGVLGLALTYCLANAVDTLHN